jgi:hypothetical protein
MFVLDSADYWTDEEGRSETEPSDLQARNLHNHDKLYCKGVSGGGGSSVDQLLISILIGTRVLSHHCLV